MRNGVIIATLASTLAGCVSTGGPQQIGPDSYLIGSTMAPIAGGSIAAQGEALQQANAFCASQGRQLLMTSEQTGVGNRGLGATVTFRCLLPGDPELRRPNLKPAPNIVIENRNG